MAKTLSLKSLFHLLAVTWNYSLQLNNQNSNFTKLFRLVSWHLFELKRSLQRACTCYSTIFPKHLNEKPNEKLSAASPKGVKILTAVHHIMKPTLLKCRTVELSWSSELSLSCKNTQIKHHDFCFLWVKLLQVRLHIKLCLKGAQTLISASVCQ